MSTKTLRKRIALVAVSALGAGMLSLVAVPSAHAATGDMQLEVNGAAASANATIGSGRSYGLISGAGAVSTTATAVMYDSGQLAISIDNAAAIDVVTVSGGTITSYAGTVTLTGLTTIGAASGAGDYGFTVKPNAAGTLLVIKSYTAPTAVTSSSGGTLVDTLTVTVTTAASAGTFSAANSYVNIHSAAAGAAQSTNADTASANLVANGGAGYVRYTLHDVNGLAMSTSTVISASATGGAVVSFNGTTFGTSVSTTYGGSGTDYGTVYVAQGVANTAASTMVSISVNGTPWATKSFTIVGDVDKITLSDQSRLKRGAANTNAFYLTVTDAAGNLINGITPSVTAGSINASVTSVTPVITAGSLPVGQSATCSTTRGTSTITYTYTNARNLLVTSNALPVVCAGAPYTYTASLDASSYAQGSIATLTISAKDSQGNPVSDYDTLGSVGASSISVTCGSQMTAVTAPAYTDTFTAGVAKYKYTVGTTAGSYNCVVDLSDYNDPTTPQAAVTVGYSIKGDGSVSTAEVLAAIVQLIASINKQIAALQKALSKKK